MKIDINNAPTKEEFEDAYPNIGVNYREWAIALAKWVKIAEAHISKLEHHHAATVGLYATDRPDLINDPKKVLFRIDKA